MRLLFLDDIRQPKDAWAYTSNPIYTRQDWSIVRNYTEFVVYIETNGLPDLISFDHDLAIEHYQTLLDEGLSKRAARKQAAPMEKTGHDCARWLVEYCRERDLDLPKYLSHSMNPVGKENILNTLKDYEIQREAL